VAADGEAPLLHAFSKLSLGEANQANNNDLEAWKSIGFDIDGWNSTPGQGYHCKPRAGGKDIHIRNDGIGGIDNSFGQHIVDGFLVTLVSDTSEYFSRAITDGKRGFLLDPGGLGEATSYSASPSQFFPTEGSRDEVGSVLAPGEDWSTYAWHPLTSETEADGSSRTRFSGSYLAGNIWVSGLHPSLPFRLWLDGYPLDLPIRQARMALDVTDRKAGKGGVIGGVVDTRVMVATTRQIIGHFGTKFCEEPGVFQGIIDSVYQSSDILLDGTQSPDRECDGISIGIGFETRASALGNVVLPTQPQYACQP